MTSNTQTARRAFQPRSSLTRISSRHGSVILVYIIVAVLFIAGSVLSPTFGTMENIFDILRQSIVVGLVTIGQVYVLIGGGIDMSVGMTARVVGLSVAVVMSAGLLPPALAIILGVVLGALIGLVNGLLITKFGAAPFVVTLGMMGLLSGIALSISDGPTGVVPDFLIMFYISSWGPIPIAMAAMAVIWVINWLVLNRTAFGRNVYATGGSLKVAKLSNIKTERIQIYTYIIAGIFAALAGIFLLSRSGVGDPNMASGLEFQSIVAATVGAVSLYGGRGSLVGALGAVLLVTMTGNIFDHLRVSGQFQDLILGLIVLISVSIYRNKNQK